MSRTKRPSKGGLVECNLLAVPAELCGTPADLPDAPFAETAAVNCAAPVS